MKNKKSKYYACGWVMLFLLFKIMPLFAQYDDNTLRNIISPAPEASSLGKFVSVPVSLYTGVPEIDIPVASLTYRDINLNISMAYHAGGNKVAEDASCIGLAWSLKAAGKVIRVIRGNPDYKTRSAIPSNQDINLAYIQGLLDQGIQNFGKADNLEPDLYLYNFDGLSGEFYLDTNGDPVKKDKNNIQIVPIFSSNNEIDGFEITGSTGKKYLFGTEGFKESSSTQTHLQQDDGNMALWVGGYTAYNLKQIKSANSQDIVQFEYDQESFNYFTNETRTADYSTAGSLKSENPLTFQKLAFAQNRLKAIKCPNWQVDFIYNNVREDLNSNATGSEQPRVLSEITLKDFRGTITHSTKFFTSYFVSSGMSAAPAEEQFYYKRLRLDSVARYSISDPAQSIPYRFKYSDVVLPKKNASAQDYWGFYNGALGNSVFMMPNLKKFRFTPLNQSSPVYVDINGGSDREPKAQYAEACILKEITYPTGGKREFTYESNVYQKLEFPQITKTFSLGISGYEESEEIFQKTQTFDLPSNAQVVDVIFEYRLAQKTYTSGYASCQINDFYFEATVGEENAVKVVTQHFENYSSFLNSGANSIKLLSHHGKVTLTIIYTDNNGRYVNATGGGLRVAKIKSTALNGGPVEEISYSYNHYDPVSFQASALTSGYIVTKPLMVSTYARPNKIGKEYFYEQMLTLHPQPLIDLSSTLGGYVGYNEVMVTRNAGENGRTLHYFTSPKDFPNMQSNSSKVMVMADGSTITGFYEATLDEAYGTVDPLVPLQNMDFKRGLLTKKIVLDKDYNIKETEELTYEYITGSFVAGLKYRAIWYLESPYSSAFTTGSSSEIQRVHYTRYTLTSGYANLVSQKRTTYATSDRSAVTQTDYSYAGNPVTLKEKTDYYEDGSNLKTFYYYTSDYSNTVANISTLRSKNLLTLPVKTEQIKSGNKVGGTINVYNDAGSVIEVYGYASDKPESPTAHDPNTLLMSKYEKSIINSFTSNQNLAEQQKINDVKEVYLWGYGAQYPVAKVIGSDYNTVKGFVNQLVLDAPATTDQQMRDELNKIRTGLAATRALVTTYIYKPLLGMTSQTDASGKTIYYEYDGLGRLDVIKDQDNNVLKRICYNYAGQPEGCKLYYNVVKNGSFTRNCGTGYAGSSVTYTVPAGTYGALTQAEADQLAQNDINANGQAYANANGTCSKIYYNVEKSGSYTRNNCESGYVAGSVTYTVAAGAYSSLISQADADQKAQNDVNANGQTNANTNGTCTKVYYNVYKSGSYTRNNCGSGYAAGSVTYAVATSKYSSTISQADADQLAQNDINANGQAYANANGTCTKLYYNVSKSGSYTRNNCPLGYAGGSATYTVAAGKYSSTISQADADQKAQNDVYANGQTNANTNGACSKIYYNVYKSGGYTRNNCAAGYAGGSVVYEVAASTYFSTISQEDADQKAQNDVNVNGQTFANTNGTCTKLYYNGEKNGTYTRNNCGVEYIASSVTYMVAAGKYSSTISQADADQKAWNDVYTNGQANANTNGTCTKYYVSVSKSGSFIRNNCATGAEGSAVTYTVEAAKYYSTISQADADQKAQNDINANGQAYANAIGSCVAPEFTLSLKRITEMTENTFIVLMNNKDEVVQRIDFPTYNNNGAMEVRVPYDPNGYRLLIITQKVYDYYNGYSVPPDFYYTMKSYTQNKTWYLWYGYDMGYDYWAYETEVIYFDAEGYFQISVDNY